MGGQQEFRRGAQERALRPPPPAGWDPGSGRGRPGGPLRQRVLDPWPEWGRNSGHTYNNTSATATWALTLDGGWTALPYLATGPRATGDALLYQTTSGDPSGARLVLTDIATGAETWAVATSSTHPAIHGDSVYHYDGTSFFRRSLADGSETWSATSSRYSGPPMFDDVRGSVYLMSTTGPTYYVTALSQVDGTVQWTRTLPAGDPFKKAVFASDLIQVARYSQGTVPATLLALSPVDGTTEWDTRLDAETDPDYISYVQGQAVSVGGVTCIPITVYLSVAPYTNYYQIVGVSATGTVSWRVDVGALSGVEAVLAGAGLDWVLVANAWDDTIMAISTSGSTLWTISSAGLSGGAVACALAGDTAFVTTAYVSGGDVVMRARTVTRAGSYSSWSTISTTSGTADGPAVDGRIEERLILVGPHAYYVDPSRSLVRIS